MAKKKYNGDDRRDAAPRRRIVVVGGGFAGLSFIKKIDRRANEVIVIDRNNFHSFPPLFYQVASAGLDAGSISFALRREMRSRRAKGCQYHMGHVTRIDAAAHTVHTQFESIPYDELVIAAGTTNNFFGIEGLEDKVYTLKSTSQAIRCRNDILERLERAAVSDDPELRRRLLTFTIIGGGPAGVEVAGALGEMKRYILRREYPTLSVDDVTVTLVEGTDRLLRTMSPSASRHALEYMKHLMVNVRLKTTMRSFDNNILTFGDGSQQYSDMVIWTAGVTGEPFEFTGAQPKMEHGNRLAVDEFNRVVGLDNVYAVGDIAYHADDAWPHALPQVAQVAIQGARTLAYNLNRGTWQRPFVYRDKGTMATVGRNRAVADLKHVHLYGRPAWFTWMLVHLMSLLGMRNRLTVLITWIWAYFTYSSSLRLILRPTRHPHRTRWG